MRFRPLAATGKLFLLIGVMVGFGAIEAPAKSPTASIGTLKQKKRETLQRLRVAETKLRAVKQQQRAVAADVNATERRLNLAAGDLRRTRAKLNYTEHRIHRSQNRLEAINQRLEGQTAALWDRLELFYKQGQVGYVEVVLGASDFEQFVDRATFVRSIASDDLRLKQDIEATRAEQEAIQAQLERDWAELDSLRDQCRERTQVIQSETYRKRQTLANVKRDRAAKEAAYREILETQREIERILWRLNRGPAGKGSFRRLRGGFILPCNGRFTSRFGWRIHPILGTRRFHDGQDIAAPSGTTIRAAAAGVVVHSGSMRAYGRAVMIDHGSGFQTLYGHCSAVLVHSGQKVAQGQPVARVGSTGWSTGPHLHFSVYRNGTAVNPLSVR